jgi:hypothetical protein
VTKYLISNDPATSERIIELLLKNDSHFLHGFSMIFMLLNILPLNSVLSLAKRKKSQGPKSGDKEDVA